MSKLPLGVPPVARARTGSTPDNICSDVLACEYASPAVVAIWAPDTQVILERRLWLEVLRAQHAQGLRVPARVLTDYERVVERVDLDSIRRRERVTRHDLKARIEEFNALAGHQHIHKGLTSCDITDNIAQARVRMSLEHLIARVSHLATRLDTHTTGRDGDAAALHSAAAHLTSVLDRYPLRGIKGAVGTAQDMLDLLGGDTTALACVEESAMAHLGFSRVLISVGQVYFRSLDYEMLCALTDLTLRAGSRVSGDGWNEGSARLRAFGVLSRGYTAMAAQLTGEQWNEGDVSCSVVRRVAIPGSVYVADAALTAVAEMHELSEA